jgi:hypothetical protein
MIFPPEFVACRHPRAAEPDRENCTNRRLMIGRVLANAFPVRGAWGGGTC